VSDPGRIEKLVAEIETLDPAAQSLARQLLEAVLDLHRDGLSRAVELARGAGLIDALARDPAFSALLLLHDLHPLPIEERAQAAVDRLRAELGVQGCTVELLGVEEGIVRVRLERGDPGHAGTAEELRSAVRDAVLSEAPDAVDVRIEGQLAPGRGEAQLVQLRAAGAK
jgi:predicted deacylase